MVDKSPTQKMKLQDFPEEVTKEGIKIYGETSLENQMAVLSQFLHNKGVGDNTIEENNRRKEIVLAIHDFLDKKNALDNEEEIDEKYALKVAENPSEFILFSDFFNVPQFLSLNKFIV